MVARLLLIFVLVLVVLGWLRNRSRPKPPKADAAAGHPVDKPASLASQPVLPCALCGVHLPRRDAVPGSTGALYCSDAHRREAGDAGA